MTRYNNPLPQNQIPQTQGRPAGAQQPYAQAPRPAARPAASGYADAGYPDPAAGAHHDPYAALRPEGYGYAQPAPQPAHDPYGLAGYTAPQPQQPAPVQGYTAPRQPKPQPAAYDPYASPNADPYGAANGYAQGAQPAQSPFGALKPGVQASAYGAAGGYAAQQPVSPFGTDYAAAPQQPAAYAPRAEGLPRGVSDQWGGQSLSLDPNDYGNHGYANPDLGAGAMGHAAQGHMAQGHMAQGHWGNDHYGDPQLDPSMAHQAYGSGQPQQGSFDQSYDEDVQYEEEPRRSGWKKAVALVAITVVTGGALTFAYSSIMGTGPGGPTPLAASPIAARSA